MSPSELATTLTAVLVGRDGAVRVSVNDDWLLHVHGVSYSIGVPLSPGERDLEGAVAAVRSVAPWVIPWDRRGPLITFRRSGRGH